MKPQYIEIDCVGTTTYYSNKKMTKFHREDGPAFRGCTGTEEWWFKDKLHRADGPAILFSNGDKQWYIHGREVTEEQHNFFNLRKQPTININGKEFTVEELNDLIKSAQGNKL
jgi:hypothetical protein